MSILSDRLKSLRDEREIMQKEVAAYLNISTSAYGFYEQDKRTPTPEVLSKLADFYNVSVDYLLGITNVKNAYLSSNNITKKDIKDHNTFMEDAKALFMNDDVAEEDLEKIYRDISELYWEAKEINKKKYGKKK
ncbi:helix-turn-helix domain-containing protein [Clostridium culturomicium]|uniref:helix-turn-helix domain-containing protein n=1 Tax=Clostridium culturomicium TaxID=1499683 RepID=UPI0038574EF0